MNQKQVQRGRNLVLALSESKWALGDLANEISGDLAEFAEKIDINPGTLRRYAQVAQAWPEKKRRYDLSFAVHQDLAAEPDRFEVIHRDDWTSREVRKYVGKATQDDKIKRDGRATKETVVEAIKADPAIKDAALEAAYAVNRQQMEQRREQRRASWSPQERQTVTRLHRESQAMQAEMQQTSEAYGALDRTIGRAVECLRDGQPTLEKYLPVLSPADLGSYASMLGECVIMAESMRSSLALAQEEKGSRA